MTKTIGILTSGGDCPGLNAVIRASVFGAVHGHGWRVVGISHGTHGLLTRPVAAREIGPEEMATIVLREAGTILGSTSRGDPFAFPMADGSVKDRSAEVIEGLALAGIDALIGIGGDGSLKLLRKLAQQGGIDLVAVPKTIDNDIALTEISVGFDTAMRVATEALDSLQPTAASHDRVMILEVMGRDAGHIALGSGIAGGADVILIPEIAYEMEAVAGKVEQLRRGGRNFALVVVAEGVRTEAGEAVTVEQPSGRPTYGGIGAYLAHRISETTGAETRVTVLGHLQRGAPPSPRDRLIASAFGARAIELVAEGNFDRMVAWQNREVVDVDLADALKDYRAVDTGGSLVRTARGLDICLGDT